MIQDLGKRMEKMQEMFTKDLEELKNKQTEMKNTPEGINNRVTEAEEQVSDMKDRMCGYHCCETEYRKKNENE